MRNECGNVLFLILIAVVLFAALSYAVTSSTRSGGKEISDEKAATFASQLIQHATIMENNIMRAKVIDDIPDYGFDFSSNGTFSGANATCAQDSCRIFTDKGGDIHPLIIPDWASTSSNPNERKLAFMPVKIVDVGTALDEVIIRYAWLTRDVCNALNKGLGITIDLDNISDIYGASPSYSGTMTSLADNYGAILGETVDDIAGNRSFCFQHSTQFYSFVHILIAR